MQESGQVNVTTNTKGGVVDHLKMLGSINYAACEMLKQVISDLQKQNATLALPFQFLLIIQEKTLRAVENSLKILGVSTDKHVFTQKDMN